MKIYINTCKTCSNTFTASLSSYRFCSNSCRERSPKQGPSMSEYTCSQCHSIFTSESRSNRKFCGKSCSASYNNRISPKRKKIIKDKPSCRCSDTRKCTEHLKQDWLAGDNDATLCAGEHRGTKKFVKTYLIETRGDQCEVCGFSEKAPDGRSIIQMDHIDGNSQNNDLENLKLLCPNHHAMTPTYGSLNMGSGRAHRRKRQL